MGAGKVDYKNLHKNEVQRAKRIRWRVLRCLSNGADIRMFGYSCNGSDGPWFGYPEGSLMDAPCVHCGQVGVFQGDDESTWRHHCPGHYGGKTLPCLEDHLCRGEPSMSSGIVPMWRSDDFTEIET